jgi:hypothetical protein
LALAQGPAQTAVECQPLGKRAACFPQTWALCPCHDTLEHGAPRAARPLCRGRMKWAGRYSRAYCVS